MAFFEDTLAALGRAIDDTIERLRDAMRSSGSSGGLGERIRTAASQSAEWTMDPDAPHRRWIALGSGVLLAGLMTVSIGRMLVPGSAVAPLTPAQVAAKDAAKRNMELHAAQFTTKLAPPKPTPAGPGPRNPRTSSTAVGRY